MKKIIMLLLFLVFTLNPADITFHIPENYVDSLADAIWCLYPVPMIDTGGPELVPEFTPNQWAKEWTRRKLINQIERWKERVKIENVKAESTVPDTAVQ